MLAISLKSRALSNKRRRLRPAGVDLTMMSSDPGKQSADTAELDASFFAVKGRAQLKSRRDHLLD